MPPPVFKPPAIKLARIESIDVLRGLTIILMVFVNDVAGVASAPSWLKHVSASTDGMTIPDLVFPAFLFVVGMSIPFAMKRRIERGQHWTLIGGHILLRGVSLLVIGVYMVNRPDSEIMGWHDGLWRMLMYLSVLAVWHSVPAESKRAHRISIAVRVIGIAALIALAAEFRGAEGRWLEHQWWGILGLIGWAYLIASAVYAVFRDNLTGLVGSVALLLAYYIAYVEGIIGITWLNGSTAGSHPAITTAGIVIGVLLLSPSYDHGRRIRWALVYAGFMFVIGLFLRPLYGINKIAATPSWCLWCSAITCAFWVFLYWLIDVKGCYRVLKPCRTVGSNALFAYIFPALVYMLFITMGIRYFSLGAQGLVVGLLRSVLFTAAMAAFAGWIGRRGFRLKL